MKKIISTYGWPGDDLVNVDGQEATFQLIQHSDHDIAFQRRCLMLLEQAVSEGNAPRQRIAYLTDRILLNEGKSNAMEHS